MTALLKYFIELCLLRKGPQDLPASQLLLIITGALLVLTAVVSDQLHAELIDRLSFALAQFGLLSVIVWAVLTISKYPERTLQTLTAFYGSGTLIQLLVWPFRALIITTGDPQQAQQMMLPLLAIVAFAVWSFVIMIHIYRNALDTTNGKAIVISVITQVVVGMSMFNLFEGLQPQTTP